jgi:hypothetical protein
MLAGFLGGAKEMRLVIGLPWYAGPDDTTFPLYFDHMMYYGALRERSLWRDTLGKGVFEDVVGAMPSLNEMGPNLGADPTLEEWDKLGRIEIAICNYSRTSLVGRAREMVVELALQWPGDYLFWWDSDMRFDHSAMLNLWRHQQLVVGGLAFTARHPIHPVIYRMEKKWDVVNQLEMVEGSSILFDYPKDTLISNEDVGGELAFGAGVVLYNLDVFREVPKPWFASTGCGEDWFFCHRLSTLGIPRFVDTAVKTQHKEHAPRWADEEAYWRAREVAKGSYTDLFGDSVKAVKDGKVVMTKLNGEPMEEVAV